MIKTKQRVNDDNNKLRKKNVELGVRLDVIFTLGPVNIMLSVVVAPLVEIFFSDHMAK